MNALDIVTVPPSAAGAAAAVRPADGAPDDAEGEASRAFSALLDAFGEPAPAGADGAGQAAAPPMAAPTLVLIRQTLQAKPDAPVDAPDAASDAAAEIAAELADAGASERKTSDACVDTALTDLAGEPDTSATAKQDAAPPWQTHPPLWSAAASAAAGAMIPTPVGLPPAAAPAPPAQPIGAARGDPRGESGGATDGLSADVGRLFDAAAGATEAVLAKSPAALSDPEILLNTSVIVLRTETHLPPVTPTTPLHQIISAIAGPDGLGAQAEPAAAGAADATTSPLPERQLVRTLDIRLEPPDLGSVTVKLRLSGQHLALQISADTVTTAQSLDQDRDTLASLLRHNGYTTEISAVRHEASTAAAPVMPGTDASGSNQSNANQAGSQGSGNGSADGEARPQGGQPGAQQQARRGAAGESHAGDHHDAGVQDAASRGGLYL